MVNAYLVESIPTGMDDLRGVVDGVKYTENVLKELVDQSTSEIWLTAMYWQLLTPDQPNLCTEENTSKCSDDSGFDSKRLEELKSNHGKELFDSLLNFVKKQGTKLNIITAPDGTLSQSLGEWKRLKQAGEDKVHVHLIEEPLFWGDGIMHQKIWTFDAKKMYLGSVNMDWKSISQVKEMGVVYENDDFVKDSVNKYLQRWADLSDFNIEKQCPGFKKGFQLPQPGEDGACSKTGPPQKLDDCTVSVYDSDYEVCRVLPCFAKCSNPLLANSEGMVCDSKLTPEDCATKETDYTKENPLTDSKGHQYFLTGSPKSMAGGKTWDLEGLLWTIDQATEYVHVEVMDFIPTSLYNSFIKPTVWFDKLMDKLIIAYLTRGIQVKLLVSQWEHTNPNVIPYLESIQQVADVNKEGKFSRENTKGTFEIKLFKVPGWDNTKTYKKRKYPGHTRVNHAKFIATDKHINIGTSNMSWEYFMNTAGASLNTSNPDLVSTLGEVFERDWTSKYSHDLTTTKSKSVFGYIMIVLFIIMTILTLFIIF